MAAIELNSTPLSGDANLVSYYRFSTGALVTDTKGALNLTNNNTVGEGTGKWGTCADFTNNNTNKSLTAAAYVMNNKTNFTLSAWVNFYNFTQKGAVVYNGGGGGGSTFGYGLLVCDKDNTNNPGNRLYGLDGGVEWLKTSLDLSPETWYHLVLTCDSTAGTVIYANNSAVYTNASRTNFCDVNSVSNTFGVGCVNTGGTPEQYLNGMVDDVAVFTRALTATEVGNLYNGTWPGPKIFIMI